MLIRYTLVNDCTWLYAVQYAQRGGVVYIIGRTFFSDKAHKEIDELLEMIEKELSNGKKQVSLLIPYSDSGIENELRDKAIIKELSYENEGIKISAEVDEEIEGRLKKYITE